MKLCFKKFLHPMGLARTFLAAFILLVCSKGHSFAAPINATYVTGNETPVVANGFTATGKTVNLTLNFAPTAGAQLMVVQNTGPNLIVGAFTNLAPRQIVPLTYGGITYH